MNRLFQSVLQPTATTGARLPATIAPTATVRGGRAARTATPAARVLNAAYIRRLPLVLKGWPPTPTPTATATPTPTRTATPTDTPTLIRYGRKGIADPRGPVTCPITMQPPTQQRTVIGQAWAAAVCATCACPGPDCP